MPLSFPQPRLWALLLMVVSNLLLWDNVASGTLTSHETDGDPVSIKGLLNNATRVSQNIRNLNIVLRRKYTVNEISPLLFGSNIHDFHEHMEFVVKTLTSCHNYSIKTPENLDKARQIPFKDFPKLILSRVWAWNETSKNLLNILRSNPETHDDVISLAKDIETKLAELSEYIQSILSSIYGPTEDVDYTIFSGLEDLRSSHDEFRIFALCKFSYCLRDDIRMIELYLELLECVKNVNVDMCLSNYSRDAS
uniref:Growth hormone d8 n=1 Tax=Rattus norvegicus TaxID=10116 RepID=Q5UFU0_RAT|nr:prolactin-like protein-F beta [Rattus norvegicus]CDW51448.1 TPA: growth hormone d8 [Rattus norvegicus]|eukprot:NP_001008342.1 prolactin family 7, subfamily a, member 4 precursor [Rattus norvegicus]